MLDASAMLERVEAQAADREIRDDGAKIRKNPLLFEIYREMYRRLYHEVPREMFPRLLELGSGGGFFKSVAPHVVTSECVAASGVDRVVDACKLEDHFGPSSLDAIVAFDVFHHLPDAAGFLRGASSVLRPGGRIVMVEPWFTPIGQWFYRALHHEPVIMDPDDWSIRGFGRLEGANSRLPTSVFRDSSERFSHEFPELRIVKCEPFHKWLYLVSGGLRFNTRIPAPIARWLVRADMNATLGNQLLGIFGHIVVERRS
jgi:SAM-dependent methyltransferase